jgi:F-type H+-transporting ATPase subunit gamma
LPTLVRHATRHALSFAPFADCSPAEINEHTQLGDEAGKRKLFIVISSDKGLCGGIHSSVTKFTRRTIASTENPVDSDSPIMVVGDKSKQQLARILGDNMQMSFNQIGRDIPTFADAAGIADLISTSGVEYDSVVIVYNKFVSAISYEAAMVEVRPENAMTTSCQYPAFLYTSPALISL